MAVNLSPIGGVAAQFLDNNGNPLTGGKIYTYAAGTTTPQTTYTSAGGVTPHANPIILDAAGRVPGGEIWLTDGLQYKFVIKTSTDVQIGSYDNIIGINSNFVNYTNSQEIQTATSGQTVFTLTTMVYQPGTNSLSVFVDGVNQYGPGALYAYTETSDTVVTFNAGLHVGAEVKFTTSSLNASSATDAEQVSYTPPFTGGVATNVELKLAQTVSAKDFGIVGNGIADDTTAFATALAALGTGVTLLLNGLTIKINGQNIISSKSNFMIDGEGATIIAADGMPVISGKELLAFRSCTDFSVKNLNVNGNRANRTPVQVAAHSIELRSCKRFVFERVRAINAVVDGFILNTSTSTDTSTFVQDGVFIECSADNSYRQGMSIINAYNITISGGSFTNTNGVNPQSGIDVEADVGASAPSNAYILIQGAHFSGNTGNGVLTSGVSTGVDIWIDSCSFDANAVGAVNAAATNTIISKCSFRNHSTSTQGIVRFPSASPVVTAGAVRDCAFSGNTANVACIYAHSTTSNISITGNIIFDHVNSSAIQQFGKSTIISNNYISSVGSAGILLSGTDPICTGNFVTEATGRGIYASGSTRPVILNNTIRDILTVVGGYIQSDDADAIINSNRCVSTTAAATTAGVYVGASSAAQSVSDNIFVNLHTTNPIVIAGTGSIKKRLNNLGGTENPGSVAWSQYVRTNSSTVANLPAASGAYANARYMVTDASATTFGSIVSGAGANVVPVYSDGTNWRIG